MTEAPEYPSPYAVGETVSVAGTLVTNSSVGGTVLLEHDGVECTITKAFWDYEVGWRYHGTVIDRELVEAFRVQATSEFTPEDYREKYPNNPDLYESAVAAAAKFDPSYVYFCEHDVSPAPVPGI